MCGAPVQEETLDRTLPANVEADSEPFGVRPPVGLGSVLFKGKNLVNGNVQAVQLYLPNSSGWTQTVL